jgi:hypothetical protein
VSVRKNGVIPAGFIAAEPAASPAGELGFSGLKPRHGRPAALNPFAAVQYQR